MLYRFLQIFILFLMKIFWHLKIINKQQIQNARGCIIAANHISWFDPPFIGSILPFPINYLAKAELFHNKNFGKLLKKLHAIPIKRGTIDRKAIELVKEKLLAKESVLIFPEGTRKSSKAKSGIGKIALETEKDILPIYIENSDKFWQCLIGKKRLKIIFGEKIKVPEFSHLEKTKENYRKLAETILERINKLKDEN
ncbi:MAG: 1-acyl-sn-glycerol-3-phosphate acyltransferase [Candidatus Cloacimonadota bacterium]|nr:MAG: 1-acyl-sn-glycerol-3-phosphate acyltransferase [Candidatus Cloacimonadota bacterium]